MEVVGTQGESMEVVVVVVVVSPPGRRSQQAGGRRPSTYGRPSASGS